MECYQLLVLGMGYYTLFHPFHCLDSRLRQMANMRFNLANFQIRKWSCADKNCAKQILRINLSWNFSFLWRNKSWKQVQWMEIVVTWFKLEIFRFEDENDYEYKIWLTVFSHLFKRQTPRNSSLYFFSPEKLALLSLLKEVKPCTECKMLKLLTFDNLFPSLQHSR